jgi:hypothetical protein
MFVDVALQDIVRSYPSGAGAAPSGQIKEGTTGFKRRFLEVTRAGARMITADQQSVLLRDEDIRAELRHETDLRFLKELREAAVSDGLGDKQTTEIEEDETRSNSAATTQRPRRSMKLKPIIHHSESNIDENVNFRLGMGRNIQNQVITSTHLPAEEQGKAGGRRGKMSRAMRREAELSRGVTAAITAREAELNKLRLDAADLNRTFMGLSTDHSNHESNKASILRSLEDVYSQMALLRKSTIQVLEALGAWSRHVMLEQMREESRRRREETAGMSTDPRSGRMYSVIIATKGELLYAKSQSSRPGESADPAKHAIVMQYVGLFKTKDEAISAFRDACVKVPLVRRILPYVDAPPMYVGLKSCGNHYLVRTDMVPPDLACAECETRVKSQPRVIVPSLASALGAPTDPYKTTLPQFIWHGKNYIDKIWNDCGFLNENDALSRYRSDVDPALNPLFLSSEDMKELYGMLNSIQADLKVPGGEDLMVLSHLKGQDELLADAKKSSLWNQEVKTGFEHMGVAYRRLASRSAPNLDRIESYYEKPTHRVKPSKHSSLLEDISLYPIQSSVELTEDFDNFAGTRCANDNSIEEASLEHAEENSHAGDAMHTSRAEAESIAWSLSRKYLCVPKEFVAPKTAPSDQTNSTIKASAVRFAEEIGGGDYEAIGAPRVRLNDDKSRLLRALCVLSQSQLADPINFDVEVVQHVENVRLNLSSKSERKGTPTQGRIGKSPEKSKTSHSKLPDSVEDYLEEYNVLATYEFKGARFQTLQTRKALAHRKPTTWCRSDVGEWKGLTTKGPNMKSFEFREQQLIEARRRIEERKQMQQLLRQAIDTDFVSCSVARIKDLMSQAAPLKALALDVKAAELFLHKRSEAIKACAKIQRYWRRRKSRVIVRKFQIMVRKAQKMRLLVETEAANFTKPFVSKLLDDVVMSMTKKLKRPLISCVFGMHGKSIIANVYPTARNAMRSREICPSCQAGPGQAIKLYIAEKHRRVSSRPPCTCGYRLEEERWHMRLYEPVSSSVISRTFTASEIISLIIAAEEAALVEPSDHLKHMIFSGPNLSALQLRLELGVISQLITEKTLKVSDGEKFRVEALKDKVFAMRLGYTIVTMNDRPTKRLLEELQGFVSSEINRFDFLSQNPKYRYLLQSSASSIVSDAIGSIKDSRTIVLGRRIDIINNDEFVPSLRTRMDSVRKMWFSNTWGAPLVLDSTTTDLDDSANLPDSKWELLRDIVDTRHHLRRLEAGIAALKSACENAEADWRNKREDRLMHYSCDVAPKLMFYEDKLSRMLEYDKAIEVEKIRIAKVMTFSKTKLEKFEMETANVVEDRDEAWMPADDGNAWIGLNKSRKLEMKAKIFVAQVCEALESMQGAIIKQREFRRIEHKAFEWKEYVVAAYESMQAVYEATKETNLCVETMGRKAWRSAMSRVCVGRSPGVPHGKLRLTVPCLDLAYIRDPQMRSLRMMRSHWEMIKRKARRLTPWDVINEHFPIPYSWWSSNESDLGTIVRFGDDSAPFNYSSRFSMGSSSSHVAASVYKDPESGNFIVELGQNLSCSGDSDPFSAVPEENAIESRGYTISEAVRSMISRCYPTDILLTPDELAKLRKMRNSAFHGSYAESGIATPSRRLRSRRLKDRRNTRTPSTGSETRPEGVASPRVVSYPRTREKIKVLEATYNRRRIAEDEKASMDADFLLSLLRLNPYSGRVSLGKLTLMRRSVSVETALQASLWYRDWTTTESPSSWANEQANFLYVHNNRFCNVRVRDAVGSVEIIFAFYGYDAVTVSVFVPLEDIIRSMAGRPVLLATLFCDILLNKYSSDVIEHIVSCIDFEVPGEMQGKLRRWELLGEIPLMIYRNDRMLRYRPAFKTHRFLFGQYFFIRLSISATDEILLTLQPPMDGQFSSRAYRGAGYSIELSLGELRSMMAPSYLLYPSRDSGLNLLHPNHFGELLEFLLQRLDVHLERVFSPDTGAFQLIEEYSDVISLMGDRSIDASLDSRAPQLGPETRFFAMEEFKRELFSDEVGFSRRSSLASAEEFDCSSYANDDRCTAESEQTHLSKGTRTSLKLLKNVVIATEIFEKWLEERRNCNFECDLKYQVASEFAEQLSEYKVLNDDPEKDRRPWALSAMYPKINPDAPRDGGRTVDHSHLILTEDPKLSMDANESPSHAAALQGKTLVNVYEGLLVALDALRYPTNFLLKEKESTETRTGIYVPPGIGARSYWTLRVATSEDKAHLVLHASPAGVEQKSAQAVITNKEIEDMSIEDDLTQKANKLYHDRVVDQESELENAWMSSQASFSVVEAKSRGARLRHILTILKNEQSQIMPAFDSWITKRALYVHKIGIDALSIDRDNHASVSLGSQKYSRKPVFELLKSMENKNVIDSYMRTTFPADLVDVTLPIIKEAMWLLARIKDAFSSVDVGPLLGASRKCAEVGTNRVHLLFQRPCRGARAKPARIDEVDLHRGLSPSQVHIDYKRAYTINMDYNVNRNVVDRKPCSCTQYCPHRVRKSDFHSPSAWRSTGSDGICAWESGTLRSTDPQFVAKARVGTQAKKIRSAAGNLVYISEPIVGPFDTTTLYLHDPYLQRSWTAQFEAPFVCPVSVGKEISTIQAVTEDIKVHMAKETAKRIVMRSLLHGITTVIVESCCKAVEKEIRVIEDRSGRHMRQAQCSIEEEHIARLRPKVLSRIYRLQNGSEQEFAISDPSLREACRNNLVPSVKRIRIRGVLMPADEDLSPIIIEADSEMWYDELRRHLEPEGCKTFACQDDFDRILATAALVYTRKGYVGVNAESFAQSTATRSNARLSRWMFEETMRSIQYGAENKQLDIDSVVPAVFGDAVIVLRNNSDETLEKLLAWCSGRKDYLDRALANRRASVIRKINNRVKNFVNYRNLIKYWTRRFRPLFNRIFGVVGTRLTVDSHFDKDEFFRDSFLKADTMLDPGDTPMDFGGDLDGIVVSGADFRCLLESLVTQLQDHMRCGVDKMMIQSSTLAGAFLLSEDIADNGDPGLLQMLENFNRDLHLRPDSSKVLNSYDKEDLRMRFLLSRYLHFEAFDYSICKESDEFLKFKHDPFVSAVTELDEPTLIPQPTATQIFYYLIRNHCLECDCPVSFCPVPGCVQIKQQIWGDKHSQQDAELGSGKHIADIAVRRFMMTGLAESVSTCIFLAPMSKVPPVRSVNWPHTSDDSNLKVAKRAHTINWRDIAKAKILIRTVGRFLVSPPVLRVAAAGSEFQMGSSGLHYTHNEEDDEDAKLFCRHIHVLELRRLKDASADRAITARAPNVAVGASIASIQACIPLQVIQAIYCGMKNFVRMESETDAVIKTGLLYLTNYQRCSDVFDPYPSDGGQTLTAQGSSIHAMATSDFEWLRNRVVVFRRSEQPWSSVASSRLRTPQPQTKPGSTATSFRDTEALLGIDRLYFYKNFFFNEKAKKQYAYSLLDGALGSANDAIEGCLVQVQILYGVLPGASVISTERNGCPPAARRYFEADELCRVEHGLTLNVYEYQTKVSRAILLRDASLNSLSKALGGRVWDLSDLARRIYYCLEILLVIVRTGATCTDIELDTSFLTTLDSFRTHDSRAALIQSEAPNKKASIFQEGPLTNTRGDSQYKSQISATPRCYRPCFLNASALRVQHRGATGTRRVLVDARMTAVVGARELLQDDF